MCGCGVWEVVGVLGCGVRRSVEQIESEAKDVGMWGVGMGLHTAKTKVHAWHA